MTRAEIQLIRSLEDKRAREETGLFVAEGGKLVRELLASDFRVRKVFHTETGFAVRPTAGGGVSARSKEVEYERIAPKDMERAGRLKTPADCLALVEIPRRPNVAAPFAAASDGELVLALDGVQNPGNIGTIIRLADWFGISDVLCSADCADCWSPKVVQATMGAVARVSVRYGELAEMLSGSVRARDAAGAVSAEAPSAEVYGTFLEGENIYDAGLTAGGVVVLGSEGRGISDGVARRVTRKLFIPPFPPDSRGSESLNVAVAAAIVCSEFRRRR